MWNLTPQSNRVNVPTSPVSIGRCNNHEARMSYDIDLVDPVTKEVLEAEVRHHITGGTYRMGGDTRLHLNVTYNFAPHFYRVFETFVDPTNVDSFDGKPRQGIRTIYGKTGAESIPILKDAISKLGDDVDTDYWKPTEGNAKQALCGLLALAQMRPDGVWDGD